jgi:hypothetical protein
MDSQANLQEFCGIENRFALHVPRFQTVCIGMERMFYPKSFAKQMNVFENGL